MLLLWWSYPGRFNAPPQPDPLLLIDEDDFPALWM